MQATLERLRERREELGDEGGFTLIELLIVIVILGILAAIVVFAVQNLAGSSAVASCQSDFQTVETAAEAYKAQTTVYPGGAFTNGDAQVAPTVPDPTTSGDVAGINDLLGTVTQPSGATLGPWLKNVPLNAGHYQIELNTTTGGQVEVWTSANPTGATAIPAAPAYTKADCSTVK